MRHLGLLARRVDLGETKLDFENVVFLYLCAHELSSKREIVMRHVLSIPKRHRCLLQQTRSMLWPCLRRFTQLFYMTCPFYFYGFSCTDVFGETIPTQIEQDRARMGNASPLIDQADPAATRDSIQAEEKRTQEEAEKSGNSNDLFKSDHILGNMGGARDWMEQHGISFEIQEVDELWGNATGGSSSAADGRSGSGTGPSYDGVTMPTLQIDMEKLAGVKGGLFNVSGLQIRGRSISQDHLSNFNPISGFEADDSTRLFELWYQQAFLDGKLDVKIGQQDLDTEFLISDYGSLYMNANFGWPMAPSVNLYAGGPSWPLASPAVRIRYRPSEKFTFMFAGADDNPPGNKKNSFAIQNGGNAADPTNQNTHDENGANFNMGTGALLITELQYAVNPQPDDMSKVDKDPGMPGVYKLGGYYDTAKYPNYLKSNRGHPLGITSNDMNPAWVRGNWMVYGIADQMFWRPNYKSPQSLGAFVRATGNGGDRNTISYAIDAGINFKAPFKGRDNDTLGLGWGIGRATYGQRAFDRHQHQHPQGSENHLELTYQAQVTPFMVMQPDFQYVWNPSGGVPDWTGKHLIGNEAIFGLHSVLTF